MIKDGRVRVNFDTSVNIGTKVAPKDKIFIDDLLLKSDMRIERPKIWMVRYVFFRVELYRAAMLLIH